MRLNRKFFSLIFVATVFSLASCASLKTTSTSSGALENRSLRKPIVIGHRGASGYLPEHTLESYSLAIEQGADFIEPDVVFTKDHVLIARHENEISETTDVAEKFPDRKTTKVIDGKKIVGWFSEDFTFAEIQQLRAKERLTYRNQGNNGKFKVPQLKDVLELAKEKNVGVYIETKHPTYFRNLGFRMEEMILDLLKTSGFLNFPDRVFIQSFEVANLKRIRSVSNIPLIQLFDSFEESPFDSLQPGAEKITYLQMASVEGLREVTKYAAGIGPWKQLLIDSNGKSTGFSERAQALGLLVHPYTFRSDQENLLPRYKGDHLNEYREYINLKVNGFFTDFPDHAARALKEAN